MDFPLDAYIERIGLASPPAATVDGLTAIHEAQVRALAFENLDILSGKGVSVALGDILEKILGGGRGGYCFELNGLFLAALEALGFEARPLLGRVLARWKPGDEPGPRTHQVSLVTIDGRPWIADVGFGGGLPLSPITLEAGIEHVHLGETLRYVEHEELGWMLQMRAGDTWRPLYAFDLGRVFGSDIVMANHFTSTFPQSPFMRFPFVSRVMGDERVLLFGDRVTVNGEPAGTAPTELGPFLEARFGLKSPL